MIRTLLVGLLLLFGSSQALGANAWGDHDDETCTSCTQITPTLGAAPPEGAIVYLILAWTSNVGTSTEPTSYTPPTGFTQIGQVSSTSDFSETTLFRWVADGSAPTAYQVSWVEGTAGDTYSAAATVFYFTGANETTPNGTVQSDRDGSSNTVYDFGANTHTAANSWDVVCVNNAGGAITSLSGWPQSLTERFDNNVDFAHTSCATAPRVSSGANAAGSVTAANTGTSHWFRFELYEAVPSSVIGSRRQRQ